MTKDFETAHEGWNDAWGTEQGRKNWSVPHPFITEHVQTLKNYNCSTILDLGCGVGRHSLYLSEQEFSLTAMDASENGLAFLKEEAGRRNLRIDTICQKFESLPFPDNAFDGVIAFNVIYHGDDWTVRKTLLEIGRVLIPGGLFFVTFLSKRNSDYGLGELVAKDTYLRTHGYDEGHPHYYTNAKDIVELLERFEILSMEDYEHERPQSFHWHLIAERSE